MIRVSSIKVSVEEIQVVTDTLKSGHVAQGNVVEELETTFSEYLGVKHAIAVTNGTAALHTALHVIGIKPGDEVITTPLSFVATVNAIMMCGAIPVFADIDPQTFNIDPTTIEPLITTKTKAVLVVDLYGNPVGYEAIHNICRTHDLTLVADSCQAIGAEYKGKKIGSVADISVFSLYATKNIFSGEGGMITTDNDRYARAARLFRNHGQTPGKQYEYHGLGYNYRMTDVLASIALPQLKTIDDVTKTRQAHAAFLTENLGTIAGLVTPVTTPGASHCFHQYTIRVTDTFPMSREKLRVYLDKKGIETKIYYPLLLSDIDHVKVVSQPAVTPQARECTDQILSLPIHQHLSLSDLKTIVSAVQSASAHV